MITTGNTKPDESSGTDTRLATRPRDGPGARWQLAREVGKGHADVCDQPGRIDARRKGHANAGIGQMHKENPQHGGRNVRRDRLHRP